MKLKKLALALSMLILGSVSMFGQANSSSLLGTVVDPAGAVVPKVAVVVTNTGTAAVNTATTDNSGNFRVNNILAGTYSVKIESKGFKALTISDIALTSG